MLDQNTINKITALANTSDLAHYNWGDRGRAPAGYVKGMAVTYGLCLQKLMAKDSAALAMVRYVDGPGELDVFDHYNEQIHDANMVSVQSNPDLVDIDRLRLLFVILTGLGMRESSGRYCCGRDTTAKIPPSSDTVEAGLFQQSWGSRRASPEIQKLFDVYMGGAPGFIDIFKEGVTPKAGDLNNYGSGDGERFQEAIKDYPAFAVQCAAIGLRTLYTEWGPIVRQEAELRPEADALFRQVQALVGANAPVVAKKPAAGWPSALLRALLTAFPGAPAKPAEAPTPTIPPVMNPHAELPWMTWALKEIGFHEMGVNRGIEKYVDLSKNGSRAELVGEPWCADFSNAALEVSGVRSTRSAMARSYEHSEYFVKLAGPAYGAIVVMWRGDPNGGSGHVCFYLGESDKGVLGLGGNQSDSVSRAYHPRNRIVGYWWPKSQPLPKVGKVAVDDSGVVVAGSEV